jgi:hypothetical protein
MNCCKYRWRFILKGFIVKRNGSCLLVIPLIVLLVGSVLIFGHCHQSGSCGTSHHSNCHDSSCYASECPLLCAHTVGCQKCEKTYALRSSHNNARLCPNCLEPLKNSSSQKNEQSDIIAGYCKECGAKYSIAKTDDCSLCSGCFQRRCSCNY